jgi:monoamine oxidase
MHESCSDVLIVGAGAAGLAAAAELSRHGLSVRMLEARERLGGHVAGALRSGSAAATRLRRAARAGRREVSP